MCGLEDIEKFLKNARNQIVMDGKKIKKQAKEIMDSFIGELDQVKEIKDFKIERKDFLREGKSSCVDEEFKDRWFKIIPKTRHGCVLAEKGKWK